MLTNINEPTMNVESPTQTVNELSTDIGSPNQTINNDIIQLIQDLKTSEKNTFDSKEITTTVGKIKMLVQYITAHAWPKVKRSDVIGRVDDMLVRINWSLLYEDNLCNARVSSGRNKGNRCRYKIKHVKSGYCTRHHRQYMNNHEKVEHFDGKLHYNKNDIHEKHLKTSREKRDTIHLDNPHDFNDKNTDAKFDVILGYIKDISLSMKCQTEDIIKLDNKFKRLEKKGVIPPQFTEAEDLNILAESDKVFIKDPTVNLVLPDGTEETKQTLRKIARPDLKEDFKDMLAIPEKAKVFEDIEKKNQKEADSIMAMTDELYKVKDELSVEKKAFIIPPDSIDLVEDNNAEKSSSFTFKPDSVARLGFKMVGIHTQPKMERPTVSFDDIENPSHRWEEERRHEMGGYDVEPATLDFTNIHFSFKSPKFDPEQRGLRNMLCNFEADETDPDGTKDVTYGEFYTAFVNKFGVFKGLTRFGDCWGDEMPYYTVFRDKLNTFAFKYGERPTRKTFKSAIEDMYVLNEMLDIAIPKLTKIRDDQDEAEMRRKAIELYGSAD